MATLITLETKIYNYKGVEVKRVDTIEESSTWSLGAYTTREWFVNGIKAHTYRVNGEVKLAFYDVPACKGGTRTILRDFQPEVPFYLENTKEIREMVYTMTGKFVEMSYEETEY